MDLQEYKKALLEHEGLPITETTILYNDFELYFQDTDESVYFKTFEEALEYKIGDKTIKEIIEHKEDIFQDNMGGRGSWSGAKAGGSLFAGQPRGGEGKAETLPPAYINTLTDAKYKSVEKTAKAFGKNFLNEGREYAGLIDRDGFALEYAKGQKTSVVHLERQGAYSIHNHPTKVLNTSGKAKYLNAPSAPDLRNWALGVGKGTIVVASENRTGYIIEKSNNFSGKAFTKAMGKAKSTGNYDKDVDKWLKKNQKSLNYKYTKIKF